RAATLARLPAERLDLLVVGGGITGAGIARDAALRGLVVALIERTDFAAGTSSRRSEEHTSELQSLAYLVCRLLLEKKKDSACSARCQQHSRMSCDHAIWPYQLPAFAQAVAKGLAAGTALIAQAWTDIPWLLHVDHI